jgi:hypothetical protein
MILSGNRDALNPILESIRALVAQLAVGHEEHHVGETTLWLVLAALGDSLLGRRSPKPLDGPRHRPANGCGAPSLQLDAAHPARLRWQSRAPPLIPLDAFPRPGEDLRAFRLGRARRGELPP